MSYPVAQPCASPAGASLNVPACAIDRKERTAAWRLRMQTTPSLPSAAVICATQRYAHVHTCAHTLACMQALSRTAVEASIDSLRVSVGPYRVQTPPPPRCEKAVHALAASHALAHEPTRPCTRAHSDAAVQRCVTAVARQTLRSAAQRSGAQSSGHGAGPSCDATANFTTEEAIGSRVARFDTPSTPWGTPSTHCAAHLLAQ